MKKVLLLVLFLVFYVSTVSAQIMNSLEGAGNMFKSDSTKFNGKTEIKLSGETKYTDYKMFSVDNDTTYIDTTLTLQKDFLFNYIRKDNFELLPFHNQGQTFNKLAYSFENNSVFPEMGMDAKQFNYYKVEDIKYYYVPTPTSEVMYRTGLEQGQVLNAFLTMNTSKQFNFSLSYKGLRSLGKYRESLASHGNFRTTFNYHSKNESYALKGHFSSFDLFNNENGGLTDLSITYFEDNDPNYTDRGRLDVNLSDTDNMLEGKRYYLDQTIMLFSKKNSLTKKQLLIEGLIEQQKIDSIREVLAKKANDSIKADSINAKIIQTKDITLNKKDSLALANTAASIKKDSLEIALPVIDSTSIAIKKIDSIPNLKRKKEFTLGKKEPKNSKGKPKEALNKFIEKDSLKIPNRPIDSISIATKKGNSIPDLKRKKELALSKKGPINTKEKPIDSSKVIISKIDSIKNIKDNVTLKLGHTFMYETKHYRFSKASEGTYFGDAYESSIKDHTSYQKMDNQLYLELNTPLTGTIRAKANYYKYNYHYNSILYLDTITISDKLKGNVLSAGADWKAKIGTLTLNADANSIVSGDLTGSSIKASVNYEKDSIYSIKGYAEVTSKSPSFNKILYQSAYKNYNWKNDFKNEEIKNVGVEFKLNKWGSINASYNLIDNFTYFDTISQPKQAKETLNYIKVKANQHFTYKNFTLENTVMYQTVLEGESFFNVPQIVTRNTLYFADHLFKGDPLYLQTGITLKYFTAFKANAYNPLLSEFVLQDETEIGNYPVLDFFFNMQVQRTRIFFKVENFGASFTGRNYYSAPSYPYRDLTIRFGLVWNFFI